MISLYASITLMGKTYLKWLDSPVVLLFDEKLIPVNYIPFPTVTICPEIKMGSENFDITQISLQVWKEIEKYGQFNNLINLTDEEYVAGI